MRSVLATFMGMIAVGIGLFNVMSGNTGFYVLGILLLGFTLFVYGYFDSHQPKEVKK